jgi:hypothetical protein
MGWIEYELGTTGELYYDTGMQYATAWTDQWAPDVGGAGGNGDGTLFYPGTTDRIGGTTPIPLESLRLKMIRNGEQDYEYLRLAGKHGHADRALAIARKLFADPHHAITSDASIETARRELADLIAPVHQRTYTANVVAGGVTVDGRLDEYAGLPEARSPARARTTRLASGWDGIATSSMSARRCATQSCASISPATMASSGTATASR